MTRDDPKALRQALIAAREELGTSQIAKASDAIASRFWRLPTLQRSRRIGLYFAVRGEVDCDYIATTAWSRQRQVYLPVIQGHELRFAKYEKSSKFVRNQYGIPEPEHKKCELIRSRDLDVVVVPTVVFDVDGNRIGMGAGYYDRSFRILRLRKCWTRPCFVGVAYEFQKTASIKASSWDIRLHFAVTESKTYRF